MSIVVRNTLILSPTVQASKLMKMIILPETGYTVKEQIFFISREEIKMDRNRNMYFASYDGTEWEVLGVDNDDLNKELNPDVETGKNVLGEATFKFSGYQPQIDMDPYYAEKDSALYDNLLEAAVQEKNSKDALKGYFVEAVFDTATETALTGTGFKREAFIVPQSTGGDTAGFGIPFNVYPVGPMAKVNVTYTIATRAVSITPVNP